MRIEDFRGGILMNKTELIAAMADQAELSKKDAEAALKAFVDVIAAELKKGEKFSWLVSALLKWPKELQERAEILRQEKQ